MNFKHPGRLFMLALICMAITGASTGTAASFGQLKSVPQASLPIEFITAEELKAKLDKGEPVTIIDVRATSDIASSESKIKGAIHVKLRRLKARLALPPLKDISRDSEVVLYCACPNDEASIRGAEILLESGFKRVHALKGGWVAWKKSKGQTEARPRG
jgi:rhodanese-related sulfurtransferase